jgi:ribonucleoside-triphosphate reductase
MVRLSNNQLTAKRRFMERYMGAANAASGSLVDPNANVSQKNIATLASELNKDINIQLNRFNMVKEITKEYGEELAQEYIRQLEDHEIYKHDESSIFPYCVSVTLYPYLLNGTVPLGGSCEAPNHLDSFCGSFLNLLYEISAQFAGAVATPEWLMYFDYFARLDFGDDYLNTNLKEVHKGFNTVVYGINEPAAARNYQAVFWNISIFDEPYFKSLFEDFVFPHTFGRPNWATTKNLQKEFLSWFNNERYHKILTFPVVTATRLCTDKSTGEAVDKDTSRMLASQLAAGNSFFIYSSDSVDSLASCCRLKNEIQDKPQFSFTLGAGGISTGSIGVITLDINRLIQEKRSLPEEIAKIHKYHRAWRNIIENYYEKNMLPVYSHGFISLDRQYSTIGISGLVDAALSQGIEPRDTEEYRAFCKGILETIYNMNREAQTTYGMRVNTEFVPGESLGVKFSKWAKEDGLFVANDCYPSYFYLPDAPYTIDEKFSLHGEEYVKYLDGGSAAHINMEEHPDLDGYEALMALAARKGCNYYCFNIPATVCEDCGFIEKRKLDKCVACGSTNIDHATRVIGYLKKISSYSKERQKEALTRYYH